MDTERILVDGEVFEFGLDEGKAVGSYDAYRRPVGKKKHVKRDLRAVEARVKQLLHPKKYKSTIARNKKHADREVEKLKESVSKVLTGEIKKFERGRATLKTALDRASLHIRLMYDRAFELGLQAQGHGALPSHRNAASQAQATPDDVSWIRSAVQEELSYLRRFFADIKRGVVPEEGVEREDKQTGRMTKSRRIQMYADAVDGMYAAGQVRGASDYVVIHWIMGDAEHCPECIFLAEHSPFTKESLPTTPRAGSTRCLSNCKCTLAFDYPPVETFNAINKAQPPKEFYLRKLDHSKSLKNGLPEVATKYQKAEAKSRVKRSRTRTGGGKTGRKRAHNRRQATPRSHRNR